MKFKAFLVFILILILVFTVIIPTSVINNNNSNELPYYVTGDTGTTSVTGASNNSVTIVTSSCTPSYYIENEGAYNITEYSFNVTNGLNTRNYGGTENYIILKQDNKTLLNISYGIRKTITTVSGLCNYYNVLNLSKNNIVYKIHIILSDSIKNHAMIWEGKEPLIPHLVALKNSYPGGNLSFMFGGKYSNQTIGKINVAHYKDLVLPDTINVNKFNYNRTFTVDPAPVQKNQTVFLDYKLNSIIYVSDTGNINIYNYYNHNYSIIGRIQSMQNGNLSSFQSATHYIYYTWNSSYTVVYSINKTSLNCTDSTYKNHNMAHLLFYQENYVFYNLKGDLMFTNGIEIKLGNVSILNVNVSRNINIIAMNKTCIDNYSINGNYELINKGSCEKTGEYNITYFYINNGISSYFVKGNLTYSINGYLYYHFSYIANNIGIDNGFVFQATNRTLKNSGERATDTISSFNSTIILIGGNEIELHSNFPILSPYKINITSIKEKIEFNDTILFLNVSSSLEYNIVASALNKLYKISNSTLNLTFSGVKSGNYTVNFTVTNLAGYTYNKNFTFEYKSDVGVINNQIPLIKGVEIMKNSNGFYVKVKGNLTSNATIAWYVNGEYSNNGKVLAKTLGMGIDKITVKVTEDGKIYSDSRKVTYIGNLPYYAAFAGISIVLIIFLIENFYFNNKNVDDIIKELDGSTLKKIVKYGRKERISPKRIKSRIKALNITGKISIERDMDNNKFIFVNKSFMNNRKDSVDKD